MLKIMYKYKRKWRCMEIKCILILSKKEFPYFMMKSKPVKMTLIILQDTTMKKGQDINKKIYTSILENFPSLVISNCNFLSSF